MAPRRVGQGHLPSASFHSPALGSRWQKKQRGLPSALLEILCREGLCEAAHFMATNGNSDHCEAEHDNRHFASATLRVSRLTVVTLSISNEFVAGTL